jgi:hypothetical protein
VTRRVLESWSEVGFRGAAFCVRIMYYSTTVESVSYEYLSYRFSVYANVR